MAEYESVLMTKQEIIDHYKELEADNKICPIYKGKPQGWGFEYE